jgi:hypothetical protein
MPMVYCHVSDGEPHEMAASADGRGATDMSEIQRKASLLKQKIASCPMKISFASRVCLDLNLPFFAAANYSAIP